MELYIITALLLTILSLICGLLDVIITRKRIVRVSEELTRIRITPGNSLYRVKRFLETLSIKLTIRTDRKLTKFIRSAEKRLVELNHLDDNRVVDNAERLFAAYGSNLVKAHFYIQMIAIKKSISEYQLHVFEQRINEAENKFRKLKTHIKLNLSLDIIDSIKQELQDCKTALFYEIENDGVFYEKLLNEGFEYGQLLKLHSISLISSLSIQKLLEFEMMIATKDNEDKMIPIDLLLFELEISKDTFCQKIKQNEVVVKKIIQNQLYAYKHRNKQLNKLLNRKKNHLISVHYENPF